MQQINSIYQYIEPKISDIYFNANEGYKIKTVIKYTGAKRKLKLDGTLL